MIIVIAVISKIEVVEMSGETECVNVTLKLPKPIVAFVKDIEGDVEKFLTYAVVDFMMAHLEAIGAATIFMKKYGLKRVFKEYGVLRRYYGDP